MSLVTIKLKEYRNNASPTEKSIIDYVLKKSSRS